MRPEQILDVGDRAGSQHRHLHVISKSGPTPRPPAQARHRQEAPQGLGSSQLTKRCAVRRMGPAKPPHLSRRWAPSGLTAATAASSSFSAV